MTPKQHTAARQRCLFAGCDKEATRRGLCPRHYMVYTRRRRALPAARRAQYEQEAIKNGLLLPDARRVSPDDPFQKLADELLAAEVTEIFDDGSKQPQDDGENVTHD